MNETLDLTTTVECELCGAELWTLYVACRLYGRGEPLRIVRAIHQSVVGDRSLLDAAEDQPQRDEVLAWLRAASRRAVTVRLTHAQWRAALSALRDVTATLQQKRSGAARRWQNHQQTRAIQNAPSYGISTRSYRVAVAEGLQEKLRRAARQIPQISGGASPDTDPAQLLDDLV